MKKSATYYCEKWNDKTKKWMPHSQHPTLKSARTEAGYLKHTYRVSITKWQSIEVLEIVEPRYKVVRTMRVSQRRSILRKGLTLAEARRVVAKYPDSSRSMVWYTKQN
jgi:hypothetical protein